MTKTKKSDDVKRIASTKAEAIQHLDKLPSSEKVKVLDYINGIQKINKENGD